MLDPIDTITTMLGKDEDEALSTRLALAIAHLEKDWERLPYDVRVEGSSSGRLKGLSLPLRETLDLAESPGDLNPLLTGWLSRLLEAGKKIDVVALLAFVVETDRALQKLSETREALAFLRTFHFLPDKLGGPLWIWDGPPWLVRELKEMGSSLTPLHLYRPPLANWLTAIRFARSRIGERSIFFESLTEFLLEQFEPWREEPGALDIRVGLFSLRGKHRTKFQYTDTFASQVHGFRARAVEPTTEYHACLRRVLSAASDPERGVQILVLPELSIDGTGLSLLRDELREMSAAKERKPPLLTIAGSFHFDIGGGRWENRCEVLDCAGHTVWSQGKAIPYPELGLEEPAVVFEGAPKEAGPADAFVEHIEPAEKLVVVPSPLGWLAVAICSDLVPFSTGGPAALLSLPVDWVFIPSMSARTEPFLEVSRELARTGKVTCFVNASSAAELWPESKPPETSLLRVVRSDGPPLAAFVNLPGMRPIGLWLKEDEPSPPTGMTGAWVGIQDEGSWDGLVVDLLALAGS